MSNSAFDLDTPQTHRSRTMRLVLWHILFQANLMLGYVESDNNFLARSPVVTRYMIVGLS